LRVTTQKGRFLDMPISPDIGTAKFPGRHLHAANSSPADKSRTFAVDSLDRMIV
jgi:hypothetical protein